MKIEVIAGLVPAIDAFDLAARRKTWMPGPRPGMMRPADEVIE